MLTVTLTKQDLVDSIHRQIGGVAVETILSDGPPRRSQRAELPHWAPTSGAWRQSARVDVDARVWVLESSFLLWG